MNGTGKYIYSDIYTEEYDTALYILPNVNENIDMNDINDIRDLKSEQMDIL